MCWMLDVITEKEFSKQEIKQYAKEYAIDIYDKTSVMANAEANKHYYSLSIAGCACAFRQKKTLENRLLLDLLEDCAGYGQVILFFYYDEGDYRYIADDIYMYVNSTKKVEISYDLFCKIFLTEGFIYDDMICVINK